MSELGSIEVTVLGTHYPVRKPKARKDVARIERAAEMLNDRITTISKTTGELDRAHLAVMAGLALADELLEIESKRSNERADDAAFRDLIRQRSHHLQSLVDEEIVAREAAIQ